MTMTERGPVRNRVVLTTLAVLCLVAGGGAQAQQETQQPGKTTTLKTGITYEDSSSESCEKQNENNPYTGMNPLVCYGVMAPADSRGQCSLSGMQVWKQQGNTCYYCQLLNPPINGFIVPMDQVADAEQQGFRCGVDQADACMAVCEGNGQYRPPPGTTLGGGTPPPGQGPGENPNTPQPEQPQYGTPGTPQQGSPQFGGVSSGATPCEPFGPGGYNYCANPAGTQPAGCVCPGVQPEEPTAASPETPGGLPLPPNVRQALMNAAAKMDQIADNAQATALAATDHFFKCLAEAVSADLKFLAQPGYVPAAQIAQALHDSTWNYLTSNAYANNLQLFTAAQQTLNNFKQDPACAVANFVPQAAVMAATHLAGAAAEATAAQRAANEAILLDQAGQKAALTAQHAANGLEGKVVGNAAGAIPAEIELYTAAECGENLCVPLAIAKDLSVATGEPLTAVNPFQGQEAIQMLKAGEVPNPPLSFNTMKTLFQSLYQNVQFKGPPLSQEMLQNQAAGIPTQMASVDAMTQSLNGVPGARGIVIVNYAPSEILPEPVSHAFNAIVNNAGIPEYIDMSQSKVTGAAMFDQVTEVFLFRTQ